MKPNKEAHLTLRHMFTDSMASCRTANAAARKHIALGRKCREEARASTDPTLMLNRGLTMAEEGVKMRLHGSRELCLALAFLNNTPYLAAEQQPIGLPTSAPPSIVYLRDYLMRCFDLREGQYRTVLTQWMKTTLTPQEILNALVEPVLEEPAQASA